MALARPTKPRPEQSWSGWGDPSQVPALPESVRNLLVEGLGVSRPSAPPASIDEIALPGSRLSADAADALKNVVGSPNVLADKEVRLRHTRGKSTLDLLRVRARDAVGAPDLVLLPGSHDEVVVLLGACTEHRIAVVPFGGGTSVVGGLEPRAEGFAGVVALDVRRMNALLELDEESRLAVLEPGLRGPEAEALLNERGYTIGHFPQSFEYASLGGFAAARSSGQASSGYGRFDELVLALTVATPAGSLSLGRAPKSAAGPDLRQLVLGSEGALGVITSLTVQVRPLPKERVYEGWRFGSFWEGAAAVRRLAQDGPLPTVVRLSDEAETALNLAQLDDSRPAHSSEAGRRAGRRRETEFGQNAGGGAIAIVGYEGAAEEVAERRAAVTRTMRQAGAQPDPGAGEAWAHDRYRGPYLRDALLNAGALVETLETAAFWSSLSGVYAAVSEALRSSLTAQGTPPVVLCHISHVYPAGASLYFTVGCAQLEDPGAQWREAKAAASDAILSVGGSITHHHGVGTDHLPWYEREVGELGVQMLRAVKARLDPAGILNPGVLIPVEGEGID